MRTHVRTHDTHGVRIVRIVRTHGVRTHAYARYARHAYACAYAQYARHAYRFKKTLKCKREFIFVLNFYDVFVEVWLNLNAD